MDILTLDFETYFADDFTLRKLTTEAYIRDPRFEVILLGVRYPDGSKEFYKGEEIEQFITDTDWSKTAVLAHHAQFDGLILSHHYGVEPAFWFDTLSMARQVLGNHLSVALSSLAKHYGFQEKTVPYDEFKGRRPMNIPWGLMELLGEGCLNDCDLTWKLFRALLTDFPSEELRIIDMTVRMFTEPHIVGDVDLLRKVQYEEWGRKADLLNELGVTASDLQSSAKFSALLEAEGVDVAYKDTAKGSVPAIAKTDDFMKGLTNDPDPRISGLAQARLDVRSTIDETRAGRLAGMAERGGMAIYLQYCGAHTTRWSGGDKVNFQNLSRGSELRKALLSPRGHLIGVADLSQIECRVENWFAGQSDVLEAFATGRDLYSEMASAVYNKPIDKKNNPEERHLGKVLVLGAGYGMGSIRLQATCKAGALGGPPIILSGQQAQDAINAYRARHPGVVKLWKDADFVLSQIVDGKNMQWGPLHLKDKKMILPNGGWINYTTMEYHEGEYRMKTRNGWTKYYGAKLVENVVQALSRVVMSQAMLRIQHMGLRVVNTTHDEVMVLIPDDLLAQETFDRVIAAMTMTPSWLPGIPLAAEGGISRRYDK